MEAGSRIGSMCSDVLSKFWSGFKRKSRKKASNNKTFTKDDLCSIVSSTIISLTFPPDREYYSVLRTIHLNVFLGLKIVPSSPHSLNLSCQYCSRYWLSRVVLPQSP